MQSPEHPGLALRVSDADRQRATETITNAYCDGRIDEVDLDQRLSAAMGATTRRDLVQSCAGLPPAPRRSASPLTARPGTVVGGLAHLSALFSWVLGPLLVHALATPGSPARREAARAFNFQLVAGIMMVATVVLGGLVLPGAVVGGLAVAQWLLWLTLTIVGGARAFSGQPWANPVLRVVPWEALDTRGR